MVSMTDGLASVAVSVTMMTIPNATTDAPLLTAS